MNNKLLLWKDPSTIEKLTQSLKENRASVISTDTVLGLLADVTQSGFESLNKIKQRSEKTYIVLVSDVKKLHFFVDIDAGNKKLLNLINKCWPGPVTIVFKAKENIPDYLKTFQNTIAIRIPKHADLLQLLTNFDGLFSTSANLSGGQIPEQLGDLSFQIENSVDYIVIENSSNNYRYPVVPSTIIDCTQDKIKVIRQGIYPLEELEEFYGEKFSK